MNNYKYAGSNIEAGIIRISDGANIPNSSGNRHWKEFQEYIKNGGQVDPYKTFDEWVKNALSLLLQHHDSIIAENSLLDLVNEKKKDIKLRNALRREMKGNASLEDTKLLDNDYLLISWIDDMKIAAESNNHGEQWIEDPERTEQELINYDPALVLWPEYPL